MLVLNRKCDQEILIDGNICVKVLSVKGNTVRIGIEAPGEVSILRGELVEADNDCEFTLSPQIDTACDAHAVVEAG